MQEQLGLELDVEVTKSRVTVIDPETGERGATFTNDGPCGCIDCNMQHGGGVWTHRRPYPHVYLLGSKRDGGLMFCAAHIAGAISRRRAR